MMHQVHCLCVCACSMLWVTDKPCTEALCPCMQHVCVYLGLLMGFPSLAASKSRIFFDLNVIPEAILFAPKDPGEAE